MILPSVCRSSFDQCGFGRAADVPVRAVVGEDHPVRLQRLEHDPRLLREARDVDARLQPHAQAHRRQRRVGRVRRVVPRGVDVRLPRPRRGEAQRVVDDAARDLVVAREPGEDRQPGGVGRRPARGPQRVRAEIPDRTRAGLPAAALADRARRARRAGRRSCRAAARAGRRPTRGRLRCARSSGSGTGPCPTRRRSRTQTRERGVVFETTSNGMPIGAPSQSPEPKSGWSPVESPIDAISCAEFAATGSVSTRWFHALLAGKIVQRRRARQRQRAGGRTAERECRGAEHRQPSHAVAASFDRQRDRHRVPLPSRLSRSTCRRAARRSRADHEPEPRAGNRLPRRGRRAEEAEKSWPCSSIGMPIAGVGDDEPNANAPFFTTLTVTAPPASVNFTAFETRLSSTCVSRSRVAANGAGDPPTSSMRRSTSRSAALGRSRLDATRRELGEVDVASSSSTRCASICAIEQQILDELVQPVGAAADHVEVRPARSRRGSSPRPAASRESRRSTSAACAARATRWRRTRRACRSSSRSAVTSRSVQIRPAKRPSGSVTGAV